MKHESGSQKPLRLQQAAYYMKNLNISSPLTNRVHKTLFETLTKNTYPRTHRNSMVPWHDEFRPAPTVTPKATV
jgi:hypothetical protein